VVRDLENVHVSESKQKGKQTDPRDLSLWLSF